MSTDLFNAEIVEMYLNNELSAEERRIFEQHLHDNPEFSEFFKLFTDIDKAVADHDVMELRHELNSIFEMDSQTWAESAPMVKVDPFDADVEMAIKEDDVMHLRSLLNEIHELNSDELVAAQLESINADNSNDNFSFISEEEGLLNQDSKPFEEEMFRAIMEEDVMNLRSQLQLIGNKTRPETKKRTIIQALSKYAAIASIFLIIIMGSTFWVAVESIPMKPDKVVENYFGPYEKGVYRGAVENNSIEANESFMEKAFVQYNLGNHANANDWFEEVDVNAFDEVDGISKKMEYLFFSGISLFMENNLDRAIDNFNYIIENRDNTSYGEEADWYLAGCYLKNEGTRERGIKILRGIAILQDHDKYDESIMVLKKMKKLEHK